MRVSASVDALVMTSQMNGKIITRATGRSTRCQALGRRRRWSSGRGATATAFASAVSTAAALPVAT